MLILIILGISLAKIIEPVTTPAGQRAKAAHPLSEHILPATAVGKMVVAGAACG